MNTNKTTLLVTMLLVALPACDSVRRKTTVPVEPVFCAQRTCPVNTEFIEESSESSVCIKPDNRLIVDEDLEGFVLEEEGANPFTSPAESSESRDVALVKPETAIDDSWIDQRLEQMQEHGLKTIYFGFNDYVIRPDQEAMLEYNARKVADLARKGRTIVVEGHACSFAGSAVYNMMLSEKRATGVAQYLMEKGIPKEQLKIVGRGSEMCIVPEGDMDQQAPNRRVEIYALNEEANPTA